MTRSSIRTAISPDRAGPPPGERRLRQREPARLARRLAPVRLQPFEPRFVLVHLRELAVAAVALHELLFAGDLLGLRAGVLGGPRVALLTLPVIRAVIAAEGREPSVAQLPDPGDGRVEERPVVRRDHERARPATEVLLEPLERIEVEVVRRLVEQEEVRIGDDQAGERGARLLATGQARRRPDPLVPGEAKAAQRRLDALVQRVPAQDLEPMLEIGVPGLRDPALTLVRRQLLGHGVEVRRTGPDRRAQVRARP